MRPLLDLTQNRSIKKQGVPVGTPCFLIDATGFEPAASASRTGARMFAFCKRSHALGAIGVEPRVYVMDILVEQCDSKEES